MERFTHWSAWAIVVLTLVFAAVNWSVLSAVTTINLLVAQVQAPTGVILLGLTAALAVLFFLATLYSRIGALMEARRLQQELRAAREVADRTEASRLEALQHLVMSEFRLLNERITKLNDSHTPQVLLP
jgi:uncharacterized integral membrane protein